MADDIVEQPVDRSLIIEPADPGHPAAAAILRQYMVELVERYYDRPTTDPEIDQLLKENSDDDLVPPTGLFLLAWDGDAAVGCVGLRRLDPKTCELTRMFVVREARRRGIASRLIAAAEDAARELGSTRMRLETRKDLVEARALYPRHGYVEIPDYNGAFFADHWFEKQLTVI